MQESKCEGMHSLDDSSSLPCKTEPAAAPSAPYQHSYRWRRRPDGIATQLGAGHCFGGDAPCCVDAVACRPGGGGDGGGGGLGGVGDGGNGLGGGGLGGGSGLGGGGRGGLSLEAVMVLPPGWEEGAARGLGGGGKGGAGDGGGGLGGGGLGGCGLGGGGLGLGLMLCLVGAGGLGGSKELDASGGGLGGGGLGRGGGGPERPSSQGGLSPLSRS